MAGKDAITERITQALETAERCVTVENSENYNILGTELDELESSIGRELKSHVEYRALLEKLQGDSALTADELKTLRSLIVGDADSYLKYDDDFERSKSDLGKILDQIRQLRSNALDPETLAHLRVLCREATSVLAPTAHYLEQKERVQRFEHATRGPLDHNARRVLVGIINKAMT